MADYTLRNVKGSELTFSEVDNNFIASRSSGRFSNTSLIEPPTGLFFSQADRSIATTSRTPAADTIQLSPICLGYTVEVDEVSVWQSGGIGTPNLRILVYTAGSDNLPASKVAETTDIAAPGLAAAATGTLSYTFSANTLYWVGMYTDNNTATYECIASADMRSLGFASVSALGSNGIANALQLGSTPLGSAPATWTFASSQLVRVSMPLIAFRAV